MSLSPLQSAHSMGPECILGSVAARRVLFGGALGKRRESQHPPPCTQGPEGQVEDF